MNAPLKSSTSLCSDRELEFLKLAIQEIDAATKELKKANQEPLNTSPSRIIHPWFNDERRMYWKKGQRDE